LTQFVGHDVINKNTTDLAVRCLTGLDVDVDVVDLRAQADASMPASNNNVNYTI